MSQYAAAVRGHYESTEHRAPDVNQMLLDLREQRQVYSASSFPAAVAFIASIAMPKDMFKIKKEQISERTQAITTRFYCSNYGCNGVVRENDTCNACSQRFCHHCDKRLTSQHSCKEASSFPVNTVLSTLRQNPTLQPLLETLETAQPSFPRENSLISLIKRQKTSNMSEEKNDRDLLQAFDLYLSQTELYKKYENALDELLDLTDNKIPNPKEIALIIKSVTQK